MSRHMGVVCAGALLLAAGCALDSSVVAPVAGLVGGQQVVVGSVEVVSAQLQAGLSDTGLAVLAKHQGRDVRLVGITRSGKVFSLLLKRERAKGGDRTRVSVKWDREADEEFWQTVVGLLADLPAPARKDAQE